MSWISCRSLLMTCALFPERFRRAGECGADIGTIDLEDSVPVARKEEARQLAVCYLAAAPPEPATAVRVNSLRSQEGMRDLLALLAGGARPDILFLPKVEGPEEVVAADQLLAGRLPQTVVLATIETARGMAAVESVAAAGLPRLWGLIFGGFDYSADLGSTMSWEDLFAARGRLLAAAAQSGLPVIDSPCFDLEDARALAEQIELGRRMGFAGKAAVHPSQVAAINAGFTPDAAAVAEAREVLTLAERSGAASAVREGRMVVPATVRTARRVLAAAARATGPGPGGKGGDPGPPG